MKLPLHLLSVPSTLHTHSAGHTRQRAAACLRGLVLSTLCLSAVAHAQTTTSALAAPEAASEPIVPSKLDAELFNQLLLSEINARSAEPGTGFSLMLDAARKTNEAALYERAVDMAIQARAGDAALQAARAWRQAQPSSALASERTFQILVALTRLPESVEALRSALANTPPAQRSASISRSVATYSRLSDKKLAVTTLEQGLSTYLAADADPALATQAWSGVGRLRLAAADIPGAMEAARKAQTISANSDAPAMLALEMIDPKQPEAEEIMKRYLATDKPRNDIRLNYARVLIDAQRYADASQQVQAITKAQPELADAWLLQGSLQLQENQLPAADTSLKRYVQLVQDQADSESAERQRGLTQAYLALAQVAEKRKDFPLAESWIAKIDSPQALVSAQNRRASILAKQGKIDEARALIRALPDRSEEDKRVKLLTEVQLLRDNQKYQLAYDLLKEALASTPQDHELLYDQAMMAEKLERFPEMERLLRQVISIKPDYSQAYNALGYSLAERNQRLPEAKALIQKALEYAPGDPYITDSLGWVEFRMGRKAEAIKLLETAYRAKPDAEIAAHLGEVYWVNGQRDKAIAIWKEGMLLNPDNDTLRQTLKRLRVKL
jgi:tetratricopeptide (TPR) repeat protein